MRVSIKGKVAIPKEVWSAVASIHQEVAAELATLIAAFQGDCPSPVTDALDAMRIKHMQLSEVCEGLAKKTKPGRPKGPPKPQVVTLAMLMGFASSSKKKVGRPPIYGPKGDRLTYRVVEGLREALAASNRVKPTIKAAIESLIKEVVRDDGVQIGAAIKDNYESVRASYGRGNPFKKA